MAQKCVPLMHMRKPGVGKMGLYIASTPTHCLVPNNSENIPTNIITWSK